tara:strand:+ start:878 stop:1531 length:654 start_codon:yes stop_codon:yes gene_type:complete
MSFQQSKYQVIKNAIPYELANFCFNYFLLKRDAVDFMYNRNIVAESPLLGTRKDQQVPGVYSHYADFVMETLLVKVLPIMAEQTGLDLVPTYSYARIYEQGSILKRHKDRPSCEISTTLNLGGDPWPIFLDTTGSDNVIDEHKNIMKPNAPAGIQVNLEPGDMLVYSGCELEHWRDEFQGNICGQVFLHYNHRNGQFAEQNKFDKRAMLGLPSGINM